MSSGLKGGNEAAERNVIRSLNERVNKKVNEGACFPFQSIVHVQRDKNRANLIKMLRQGFLRMQVILVYNRYNISISVNGLVLYIKYLFYNIIFTCAYFF